MNGYERLIQALESGWVTREEVQGFLALDSDREGRDIITGIKKKRPVLFGTATRPGYHIAKEEPGELADIDRCIWHYKNMMADMSQSLEQLLIQRDKILHKEEKHIKI